MITLALNNPHYQMLKIVWKSLLIGSLALCVKLQAEEPSKATLLEVKAWQALFAAKDINGTIALLDLRQGDNQTYMVLDAARAQRQYLPASTFKIPHALVALHHGAVADELQKFSWDGKPRGIAKWNQDQTLESAIRYSTVWVFQELARQIGRPQELSALQAMQYGNQVIGSDLSNFWLDDSLQISALEQVQFLLRLYRNSLPFSTEHQQLVKKLMVNEANKQWTLRAKTGWGITTDMDIGWFVGWLESTEGVIFFAMNMDMPNGIQDASKRKQIVMDVLNHLGAL